MWPSNAPPTEAESHSVSPVSRCATSTSLAAAAYSRAESTQTRLSQKGGHGTPQSNGQLSWVSGPGVSPEDTSQPGTLRGSESTQSLWYMCTESSVDA